MITSDSNLGTSRAHAFRRTQRLTNSVDYGRVFKEATRSADDSVVVLARRNGGGPARLGLAIGKKAVRRAVDRNRIKRIARETFRHQQQLLVGLDIVILARHGLGSNGVADLRERFDKHFIRVERRCEQS
ncbi:MAG: ribonuclease P protein component [Gammaproteobacteria bacterium]|nr:ribonuclease P protein component [Gammaproteobacteria bacterium]